MEELFKKVAEALFSQCGVLTIVGWLIAGYLVWVNYRINEAREKEREACSRDAEMRIRAFESLAASLAEMRGFMTALVLKRD